MQLSELINQHGVDVLEHLDRSLDIPVVAGVQRQGDVIVVPSVAAAKTPVTAAGVPVVRGENGGNTHSVVADGNVLCDLVADPSAGDLRVATLTVKEDSTAYLAHPEHGYLGVAPGHYEIRRQREQADEIRMVAD